MSTPVTADRQTLPPSHPSGTGRPTGPARPDFRSLADRLRPWLLPGVLAAVLAAFLAITPWGNLQLLSGYGGTNCTGCDVPSMVMEPIYQSAYPEMVLIAVVGSLSAIAGVALARRRPLVAVALAAWPFLAAPFMSFFLWGWWLALVMIAVVAAVDSWRRTIAATIAALVVAAFFCSSVYVTAILPVGPVQVVSDRYEYTTDENGLITTVVDEHGFPVFDAAQTQDDHLTAFLVYAIATLLVVGIALVTGIVRRRLRRSEAVAEEAVELEVAATERARVARDLHDVVAHHISLIAVRAESAPYTVGDLGAGGEQVLAAVAEDARETLDELRQILTVLRRADDPDDGALLAPQPGSQDIACLVDSARSVGQVVDLNGPVPDLPTAPGYVLYRAVQESLTNARRHAPGTPVTVDLTADGEHVRATIRNPLGVTAPGGTGRGLVGMRERVESVGGTLAARAVDGVFVVDIVLPAVGSAVWPLDGDAS